MMYKALRHARIAISGIFLLLLTWTIVDASLGLTRLGSWIMEVQIVPAILSGAVVWLVIWVLITLTVGRVYCSTVCPLGTVMDIAGNLGRKTGRGANKRYRYAPPMISVRIVIPLVVAACLFAGITAVVQATDPYSVYRRMVLAIVRPATIGIGGLTCAILLFLAIWYIAWRRGRLLCNTICPAGGLLGFLGRTPVYNIDINTDKCVHCGKCEDVCKSSCINLQDCTVDTSRCVMCMDCTAVCPNGAITLRRGRHKLSDPMMIRV